MCGVGQNSDHIEFLDLIADHDLFRWTLIAFSQQHIFPNRSHKKSNEHPLRKRSTNNREKNKIMIIANRQVLQHHARVLQSRATAVTALLMTIFLFCIEHVRAFASQYHITSHDAMVLASAASSLTRKLSSTYLVSGDAIKRTLPKTYSFFASPGKTGGGGGDSSSSSTQLNAWSIPAIAMPSMSMPTLPTSKDLPIHTLWSWYSEVDPTTKPPVYDE